MSRSTRAPWYYLASGADPGSGKSFLSRSIRHLASQALRVFGMDFDFTHVQDRVRGLAGSRSRDYGWTYFGDGRVLARREPWKTKYSRK